MLSLFCMQAHYTGQGLYTGQGHFLWIALAPNQCIPSKFMVINHLSNYQRCIYPAIVIEGFILFACLFFVGLIFEENILKLQVHYDEEPRLPCLLVFKVWGRSFPKTKQLRKHNFVSERPLSLTQLWICSFGVKRYLLHTFSFVSSLIIIIIITMHL